MSEDGVADVKPRTKETLLGIQTLLESKRGLPGATIIEPLLREVRRLQALILEAHPYVPEREDTHELLAKLKAEVDRASRGNATDGTERLKRGLKAVVAFSMAPAQELLAEMAILV